MKTIKYLVAMLISIALAACGGGSTPTPPPATYSISGTITSGGTALAGATVTLGGASTATATTDASGNYSFTGLVNGTYSITPSLTGVIFEPSVLTTTISGSGVANQNFVELVTFVAASGIQFLPASFSSANQYRVSLVPTADSLYFTDSSNEQLKRIDASSGAVTSMVAPIGTPESVVIHGQHVFWVDGNRLNKTALDGTSTTILQAGARDPVAGVTADIAVDDTNAYWANTNCSPSCNWIIQRVPVTGGTPITLVNTTRKIAALTADANNIYWEEASFEPVTPGCECGSSIKMIPKTGGAVVLLVDNRLNGTLPAPPPGLTPGSWVPTGGIAVSGSQLFFGVAGGTSYQIMSVAVANAALTTLASVSSTAGFATGSITGLNADSTNVYWADGANATVDTVPINGGAVVSLATGLSFVTDLTIAAGMASWTQVGVTQGCCLQMGTGSIRQIPVAGGVVTTVIGNLDAPGALAIDASNNVVWAELWRVAKWAPAGVTTLAGGISSDLPRIAADQTNLYVLDGDLIKTMPLSGGRLEKLAAAHGGNIGDFSARNQDITADGTNVYWLVTSPDQVPIVRMVPASGGAVVTLAVSGGPAPPQDCYWRIAVDAQNVYWSAPSSSFPVGCTVKKVPIIGGAVTTLVDFAYMADFATDGVNVYFSELESRSIWQTSVNGGPITMVTSNTTAAVLAVDAQNIYWMDPSGPGGIWRIAKAGGPAGSATLLSHGPLATDPLLVRESLVVSQGTCFWSESLDQTILFVDLP